jgi:hypothetical protein
LDCASVASHSMAYLEFVAASHLLSLRLMQLACQRISLNLRSFTVQEIAELSEILTVQKNAKALVSSFGEATQEGERSEGSIVTIFIFMYCNNRRLTVQTWTTRTGQGPNCNTR